jgi:hypothetical protein
MSRSTLERAERQWLLEFALFDPCRLRATGRIALVTYLIIALQLTFHPLLLCTAEDIVSNQVPVRTWDIHLDMNTE